MKDFEISSIVILSKSPEFQSYSSFLSNQIQLRKDQICSLDLSSSNGIAQFNFLKGEISGLETAKLLPAKVNNLLETEDLMNQMNLDMKENDNGR